MKATDLIVGDWVAIGSECFKHYGMVKSVDVANAYVTSFVTRNTEGHSLCSLDPIPLTAEILEKNGWKEAQFWHEYQDGKNTIQSCLPDMRGIINGVEIQNFKCEYVHQYQHLLRLCGLDDLADNFIV